VESNSREIPAKGLLPTLVVSPADVIDLRRELGGLDEFMRQAALRRSGQALALPKVGHLLGELATVNNLNLLKQTDRKDLIQFLSDLKGSAPVVHMSFAADPSSAFMSKIINWFRNNVHPQVLVQIGLQPSIGAGCMLRTRNKSFDFSLRKRFLDNRQLLLDKLAEDRSK